MVAFAAFALTACNAVQDNPGGTPADNPAKQTIEIKNGDVLADIIDQVAATAGDEIVIELPAGVEVTTGEIIVPVGKSLTIVGDEKAPAKIKATSPITISKSIMVMNVEIDANEAQNLFMMNKTPDEALKVESGQYVITDPIVFDNIVVKNLTKAFFADNGKSYAYETWHLNNSIIQMPSQKNVVFNFASSMAINFFITNSTIYTETTGTANFIAISGKRPWQITGYEEETGKFTCENNTFYEIAKSKQFMNTNTLKGQRYLYEVNNNIFYNVSNKKIYGNMTNNKKQLTASNNVYMMDGTFFEETRYNGDEGIEIDPNFTDPEKGYFHPRAYANEEVKPGDPRWYQDIEKWQLYK